MKNKDRAESSHSDQRDQEPGSSFQPRLIPKHRSILLYLFQKDLSQSYGSHVDRSGLEIVRPGYNTLRVPAGKYPHLMASGSHVFDSRDAKVTFCWNGRKDKIDSPIRLAQ